ncbi:MAG: arsenosugar biosynthesis radical SAM protein ArsS [Deltaproteobacteria bacterium]|nr:arsenosugar biosynthesis radical SAM protein ArsS [Deltaproteobacteria bacterium]
MKEFELKIHDTLAEGLISAEIRTLQVNLGRICNLACSHCHLACSPRRSEQMPEAVMEGVLRLVEDGNFRRVEITGGSPELHPRFRYFVEALCARGQAVQVRTNLTTLSAPPLSDLIGLFTSCGVSLVGSLPCYLSENVDAWRGSGVHARSIAAMRLLNRAGYGLEGGQVLNLVYNPRGPFLPPRQSELEGVYREELKSRYGVSFSHLFVLTNMPLGRFRRQLEKDGQLEAYQKILREAFNPTTLPHLMCRHQISIDWDGTVYDCDFNLAIGMPVNHGAPARIEYFDHRQLVHRRIVTGNHCFGCTAGAGSSCSGMLAA